MSSANSLEVIYQISRSKMTDSEVANYVGEVVAFCINRLSEQGKLSAENLSKALKEEAEFHLKCKAKDVA